MVCRNGSMLEQLPNVGVMAMQEPPYQILRPEKFGL